MREITYLHAESGALRTAGGRLVVPIVALVAPMILHAVNSDAPEFIPLSALSSNVEQWRAKPICLGHPTQNGKQVSANDARILEAQGFGVIENPRVSDGRLLMDARIDEAQAQRIGAGPLLARLRNGEKCDVSVGCYTQTDSTPGVHLGRPYARRWASLIPDHLSFVSRGACSAADGCFARAAESHADDFTPPDPYNLPKFEMHYNANGIPDPYAADIAKIREATATFEDEYKARRMRELAAEYAAQRQAQR